MRKGFVEIQTPKIISGIVYVIQQLQVCFFFSCSVYLSDKNLVSFY